MAAPIGLSFGSSCGWTMARSSYIYVAFSGEAIIGAWTVKHEMATFLKNRHDITDIRRYRDGRPDAPWTIVEYAENTKGEEA